MTSQKLASQLVERLRDGGFLITTVESCTGGALANAITNIPGSGDIFKDGFVAYSNEAKIALGVPHEVIRTHSVYSLPTARAMAQAGLERSAFSPHLAVGITGSLNRTDPDNPVSSVLGDVYIVIVKAEGPAYEQKLLVPSTLLRSEAKEFVINHTLEKLLELL